MNADLVWGLIASLLIANVMLVVLNLPLIGLWIKLLSIPRPWLYGGILLFATLGTIGVNPSPVELGMLILFGVMGYGMRLYGYPVAPVVVGAAFVVRGTATKAVALRGIDPKSYDLIVGLSEKTRAGRFTITGAELMVGTTLASDFGVVLGDKLRILTATGEADIFTLVGIFDLGNKDLNERMVLVPLRSAQTLLQLAGGVSALELKVVDLFAAEAVAKGIAASTGLVADSWTQTSPQLLVALQAQGSSKNVILFFITLTVALGIASVLIVSVVQKSREIGIMRAVGTPRARILRIFLIQGGLVGFGGAVLGSGLGALLATGFVSLWRNSEGTPMFPIELTGPLFVWPMLLATVVGVLAAVAPARRAARLNPAEVIRYG
jgi:lipoprotein-releasing system permease protein